VVIAPVEPEPSGLASDLLALALRLLADVIRRLHEVCDASLPLNAWLHDGDHWHLELFPRTARLAGLELGAEVFINSVPPEEAAVALRR
jgi:galactose-1-phosphate uridylyltransferase